MEENYGNDIERINPEDAEEIPPVAPEAPEPNFTEAESAYAGSANAYSQTITDEDEKTAKILGIISLVCGIISLLCCCIPAFAVVLSVAALVCGIISIKKGESAKGLAIAGIVCGAVGLVAAVVTIILLGTASALESIIENMNL